MSRAPKKPPLLTPWRLGEPERFGVVQILNKSGAEVVRCKQHEAEAIVQAVNWCSSRGYLK